MSRRDLTRGPVARALWVMSAPMTVGVVSVMSIGLADAIFIGRLGERPLAAAGFFFPVIIALSSVGIGLAAGVSSVVSRALGAGRMREAGRLAAHGLALSALTGGAVGLGVWLAGPALFARMGAQGETLALTLSYMPWWCLSFPALTLTMAGNAVLRARGRALWPAALMVLSGALNVALDAALVVGTWGAPPLGVEGAGVATFAARAVTVVLLILPLARHGGFGAARGLTDGLADSARRVLGVAAPAMGANAVNPLGMAAVTAIVAGLGDSAVAGFGAATRVQTLALSPLLALSAGIGPVVGQNWGADRQDRARRATRLSLGFCAAYGVALGVAFTHFAGPIGRILTDAPGPARDAAAYLRVVGWSLAGYGALVVCAAGLNARGRPSYGLAASVSRSAGVYVCGAALGAQAMGFAGVLAAAAAANAYGFVAAIVASLKGGLLRWGGG